MRLFLSTPTTCALLLGGGLILRAQAALREPARPQAAQVVLRSSARPEGTVGSAQPAGDGERALARRSFESDLREQRRSQLGKSSAPHARRGRRAKRRAHARGSLAGSAGEGGQQ
jgi:hypothetical protein